MSVAKHEKTVNNLKKHVALLLNKVRSLEAASPDSVFIAVENTRTPCDKEQAEMRDLARVPLLSYFDYELSKKDTPLFKNIIRNEKGEVIHRSPTPQLDTPFFRTLAPPVRT